MQQRFYPSPYQPSISIVSCHGEWFVTIVENGVQVTDTFDTEYNAIRCAEVGRVRLGLKQVERL